MKKSFLAAMLLISGIHCFPQASLVGYLQNSNSYPVNAGLGLTGANTPAYSYKRHLGQLQIGDTLWTNASATIPLNGGSFSWAFTTQLGSVATRAAKIDAAGIVLDVAQDSVGVQWYYSRSGIADCNQTNFTEQVFAPLSDPGIYNNKRLYSAAASYLGNGTYTVSNKLNGQSVATFTVTGGNGLVTNLANCTPNPIVDAGGNKSIAIPASSVMLSGSAFVPNGQIAGYKWTQASGPSAAAIVNPVSSSTTITGLNQGTYFFTLTSTDDKGNAGSNTMQLVVQPPSLCNAAQKMKMLPRMVTGLSGNVRGASQGYLDTSVVKYGNMLGGAWVAFDGDFDPKNGQFDADTSRAGMQNDTTSFTVYRTNTHNYFKYGKGNQMALFVDFEQVMYWDALYWYDATGSVMNNAAEIYIGDKDKMRQALFQFRLGNINPDYTINATSTSGWQSIQNMRDTGQFMLILFSNQNPRFTSFVPYGCKSTYQTRDISITPDWSAVTGGDTTLTIKDLSGLNVATPVPPNPYWRDTLSDFHQQRGYLKVIDPSTCNGCLDPDNVSWNGEALSTNKIDLSPFGSGAAGSVYQYEPTFFENGSRYKMQSVQAPNGHLFGAIPGTGVKEIIPVDSIGADSRLPSSWGRFVYAVKALVAKVGPNANPPNAAQYRYKDDPYPGQYGKNIVKIFEIGNEWNAGFRAPNDSNWLDPMSMFVMMDTVYRAIKSVSSDALVAIGGYAAWDYESLFEMEKIAQIWYGKKVKLYDIANIHTIIVNKLTSIDSGFATQAGMKGVLPGFRDERAKYIAFRDTLEYISGQRRPHIVSEFSYSSTYNGPQDPFGSDSYLSIITAPRIKNYDPYVSQGIATMQASAHYEAVPGMMGVYGYEYGDAADTASIYYQNVDNNNGLVNYEVNKRGLKPFYKAAYFFNIQHKRWLKDYRVLYVRSDSLNGQYTALLQNVYQRDSFCIHTFWQSTANSPGARTINLEPDVTAVKRMQHTWNWSQPDGKEVPITVNNGSVEMILQPESDYLFFRSGALANSLATPLPWDMSR